MYILSSTAYTVNDSLKISNMNITLKISNMNITNTLLFFVEKIRESFEHLLTELRS